MKKNEMQKFDILVIGGSTSGIFAAIQAARMGNQVALVEETPWLGGMLSAAGVSCIDGNHRLPSGLWGEFREKIYEYYGGAEKVNTGWVSNTCFEPHVANMIFHKMVAKERLIMLYKGYWLSEIIKSGSSVKGGIFRNLSREVLQIEASITIDCTEYGDALALAGCDFKIGRESRDETNESWGPSEADNHIQDLTYVAILKDFGRGSDKTIQKPDSYRAEEYWGCCKEWADQNNQLVDSKTMLNYGRLPNNKYMINWPIAGNDYCLNYLAMNREERLAGLQEAKQQTLSFVYFLQTQLEFKNLGLADDEFPTADRLALIPYIRESRRLNGIVQLTLNELVDPYSNHLFQQGIAVGDYPLDHHHNKNKRVEPEVFPAIPSFTIPFGCLVPQKIDGLLVAEKSISVTHLVNGCTRLQPVVMQLGQAAGAAAALCIKYSIQPREINIRELQQTLLNADLWLMPFLDTRPEDWYFEAAQRIGLCGLLKGEGKAKEWSNEFWFHPEKAITMKEAKEALQASAPRTVSAFNYKQTGVNRILNRAEVIAILYSFLDNPKNKSSITNPYEDIDTSAAEFEAIQYFVAEGLTRPWANSRQFNPKQEMSRGIFAYLLDRLFHPFSQKLLLNRVR